MKVLISGCGRVGGFVAGLLDSEGHDVTVIDIDKAAFVRALAPLYPRLVTHPRHRALVEQVQSSE